MNRNNVPVQFAFPWSNVPSQSVTPNIPSTPNVPGTPLSISKLPKQLIVDEEFESNILPLNTSRRLTGQCNKLLRYIDEFAGVVVNDTFVITMNGIDRLVNLSNVRQQELERQKELDGQISSFSPILFQKTVRPATGWLQNFLDLDNKVQIHRCGKTDRTASGFVYRIERKNYKDKYVVMKKMFVARNSVEMICNEITILMKCRFQLHIVHTEEICYDPTDCSINIVMEDMNRSSLKEFMKTNHFKVSNHQESILSNITQQVLTALFYLHEGLGVIHRDIKSSNILINDNGLVKVSDFGVSIFTQDIQESLEDTGSVSYKSPERLNEKVQMSSKSDIWSLGISLMEWLEGKHPITESIASVNGLNSRSLNSISSTTSSPAGLSTSSTTCSPTGLSTSLSLQLSSSSPSESLLLFSPSELTKSTSCYFDMRNRVQSFRYTPALHTHVSKDFEDFLSKCLEHDPNNRSNVSDLLKHPFISNHQSPSYLCNSVLSSWIQDRDQQHNKKRKFST